MKTNNNDAGSLFVGQNLEPRYQHMGIPEAQLYIQIAGEEKARKVTYVMGSVKKGWHLCCKGTGPFALGEVEFEVVVR